MKFEEVYELFINEHASGRRGEALKRLKDGHGHAEKMFLELVWWPAFGNFNYLHPEFEINDYKDGYRYIDFAYIRSGLYTAIEIEGFGPHWRNISRWQFTDNCRRQNDLTTDGWKVFRFSYDDVSESPRHCQQKLHQFMGRWFGEDKQVTEISWIEKEIIRLMMRLGRPATPGDLCEHMGIENKTARKWLHQLIEKKWLKPESGDQRIRSYILNLEAKHFIL